MVISCNLPEQPKTTASEDIYFRNLEKKFKCKIEREISADYLSEINSSSGYYIELKKLPCIYLDTANLKVISVDIAKNLYHEILNNDTIYKSITVVFSCDKGKDEKEIRPFDFDTKLLLD